MASGTKREKGQPGRATFSANVLNVEGCTIKIGQIEVGKPPFFGKTVPTGKHTVVVTCPNRKPYKQTMNFTNGVSTKLIVKPEDLK